MFIALHIILERMLVEGLVDVFQTVKNLRIQRPAMLQSLVRMSRNYISLEKLVMERNNMFQKRMSCNVVVGWSIKLVLVLYYVTIYGPVRF